MENETTARPRRKKQGWRSYAPPPSS